MRLENKEEYEGLFWFPNLINEIGETIRKMYPSLQEIAGHLTIETDGSVLLSLNFPSWSEGSKAFERFWDMHNRGIHDLSRIHGIVDNKFVILLDCKEIGHSRVINRLGTNIKKYSPLFCIIRNQFTPLLKKHLIQGEDGDFKQTIKEKYPEVEDFNDGAEIDFEDVTGIEFDTLQFYFDGIDSFFQITGFNDLSDDEYDRLASRTGAKIEWKKPVPLPIYSSENFTLKVENLIDWHKNPTHDSEERKIKEYTRCVLEFPKPLPLEKCVKMIEQIKSFFAFIFNHRIGITHLSGALREKKFAESSPKGKIYKHFILHNIHYQNDDWDATQPPKNGYVPIGYKNFEESNGDSNLFAKYLVSFLEKMEDQNEDSFSTVFFSYIHRMPRGFLDDYSKQAIDLCEYLFVLFNQNYPCPGREKIKDLRKKIEILSKPLIGCLFKDETEVEHFAYAANKYRGEVTHFNNPPVYSDLKGNIFGKITVLTRFHLLEALYPDRKFNMKLLEKAWLLMMEAKEGYRTKRDFPKRYKEYFEANPNH